MTCCVTMSASHADMDQNPDFMYDRSLESEVRKANWLRDRDRGLRLREFLPRIRISRTRRQRHERMRVNEVMAGRPHVFWVETGVSKVGCAVDALNGTY